MSFYKYHSRGRNIFPFKIFVEEDFFGIFFQVALYTIFCYCKKKRNLYISSDLKILGQRLQSMISIPLATHSFSLCLSQSFSSFLTLLIHFLSHDDIAVVSLRPISDPLEVMLKSLTLITRAKGIFFLFLSNHAGLCAVCVCKYGVMTRFLSLALLAFAFLKHTSGVLQAVGQSHEVVKIISCFLKQILSFNS